jgi:hypothetical protein
MGIVRISSPRGSKKAKGAAESKMATTMDEYGKGTLHSGRKKGPKVTSRKQAIAIGLSQARRKAY